MPKIIELTVVIDIQKVSCPGVWLCQGGQVCLTVFALGTSYQTCFLPPIFPLMFKDVFYFKKRYEEACALNNICCILKDETIYCELVQCSSKCFTDNCVILAQYLGTMNDVLFPPNTCANDGVDLLMRRSKVFPGILSPKIEIATKVRIDEVWNQSSKRCDLPPKVPNCPKCHCKTPLLDEGIRQRQVCHSARYHQVNCNHRRRSCSGSRSMSRSQSAASGSCCSRTNKHTVGDTPGGFSNTEPNLKGRSRSPSPLDCYVYNVKTAPSLRKEFLYDYERDAYSEDSIRQSNNSSTDDGFDYKETKNAKEQKSSKLTLKSCYIECDYPYDDLPKEVVFRCRSRRRPCICEICTRYHELFHCN